MAIIKEIHSAYDITLKGEFQEYHWYDGRVDDVIWQIYVNDKKVYLGNAFFIISEDKTGQYINMEKDKDLLCYWLSKQNYDLWHLEQFFMNEYKSCFWRHKARQMQLKERQDAELARGIAKRKEEIEKQLAEFQSYADKKKYYMIAQYDDIYFIRYDRRKYKAEELKKYGDDMILRFAQEHPGNGVDIVERRSIV